MQIVLLTCELFSKQPREPVFKREGQSLVNCILVRKEVAVEEEVP